MKCGVKSTVLKRWQKAKELKLITSTKLFANLNTKWQRQMPAFKIFRKLLTLEPTINVTNKLLLMIKIVRLEDAEKVKKNHRLKTPL